MTTYNGETHDEKVARFDLERELNNRGLTESQIDPLIDALRRFIWATVDADKRRDQ